MKNEKTTYLLDIHDLVNVPDFSNASRLFLTEVNGGNVKYQMKLYVKHGSPVKYANAQTDNKRSVPDSNRFS